MATFLSPRRDGYAGLSGQSNDWQLVEKLSALTPSSESMGDRNMEWIIAY